MLLKEMQFLPFMLHLKRVSDFSYASFETVGYDLERVNLRLLIERALACFHPSELSIADVVGKSFEHNCSLNVKGDTVAEREAMKSLELAVPLSTRGS